MPKRKNKRKSELDAVTQDIIDRLVRIKTRARVRDTAGHERIFRSTIAEKPIDESEEQEAEEEPP